jgi:hypothetical protein
MITDDGEPRAMSSSGHSGIGLVRANLNIPFKERG